MTATRVPRRAAAPGHTGTGGARRVPTMSTASKGASARAAARARGRCEPGEQRMVLREAGRARRTAPGTPGAPSRSASAMSAASPRVRARAATIAGRSPRRTPRAPRPRRGRPPERTSRSGAEDLVRLAARAPTSRPSARSRAPARGRSSAAWKARTIAPGTSCGADGLLLEHRVLPASPCSLPARNGSSARWRRSCWPTMITSGTRFRRAVAIAATALPSPGVCAAAPAQARRGRSRTRRPCHHAPLVQRRARTSGHPAARRGTAPRCGPGWRRSSSAPATEYVEGGVADGRHACRNIARDVQLRL